MASLPSVVRSKPHSRPPLSRRRLVLLRPRFVLVLLVLVSASVVRVAGIRQHFPTQTAWFDVPIDHFGFGNNQTFPLRVLYNNEYFNHTTPGPIFLYTGNEGDIGTFVYNTGLLWDWAEELGALLVFAEHRYYGRSLPYGRDSLKNPSYFGYLSVEQALADFAHVLAAIKRTWPGVEHSKVVAFGGSYAGMLAAWLRMRYPWLVDAALASGAPLRVYQGLVDCNAYNDAVARTFLVEGGARCVRNIRRSWAALERVAHSPLQGASFVFRKFRVCSKNVASGLAQVRDWIYGSYVNLAMHNYPYGFNARRLSSYPVRLACAHLDREISDDRELLSAIFDAVNVYHNVTGFVECHDVDDVYGDHIGSAWQLQTCSELVMPYCANGKTDLSYPFKWSLESYRSYCQNSFGLTPNPERLRLMFGGDRISSASHIVFSNGDLDPWASGGFLTSPGPNLPVVIVRGGAHHYDLKGADPKDTKEVRNARKTELAYIRRWIGL